VNADDIALLAGSLSGHGVTHVTAVRGGGNNQLYRVEAGHRAYALKRYAGTAIESRERYVREFAGLTFLWSLRERRIAEPLALDEGAQAALYGWVEGTAPAPASEADLESMAAFAGTLHEARNAAGSAALLDAREAVYSQAELQRQLAARIARLRAVEGEHPELQSLLADIEREAARRGAIPNASEVLPGAARTLSPSDFGTHNALRGPAGLTFIDFEYFGWDDPVKLVADVVWHPGMALDPSARQKFFAAAADVYKVEAGFIARFERDAPMYGLRWALIVLNEFLPEVWQRRLAAGALDAAPAARARQLAKAAVLFDRARRGRVIA
jgi:hypothetical protein